MATTNSHKEPVSAGLKRLEKCLSSLESQRSVLVKYIAAWKELEEYCSDAQATLQRRIDDVDGEEAGLLAKAEDRMAALRRREEAISVREAASLARVQEQKDVAMAGMVEERRKWIEARLGERAGTYLASMAVGGAGAKSTGNHARARAMTRGDLKLHPQLKPLCDKLDSEGLRSFLVANRKEAAVMRDQLPCALSRCPDPVDLVLKALQGYDPKPDPSPGKETKASSIRRAYLSLLESLAIATADPILGAEYPVIPLESKKVAKELAYSWRTKLGISVDAAKACPLDAQTFLQLLAAFNIASEFSDDELLKLLTIIGHRKKAASLCRSLGLLGKMPDFLIKLANDGKQFDALSLANSFEILDKIHPVNILKEYLKDAKEASETALKNATNSTAKNQATMKEITAVKAVLRAITDYKLDARLPASILQMRLEKLEMMKEEKIGGLAGPPNPSKRAKLNNFPLNSTCVSLLPITCDGTISITDAPVTKEEKVAVDAKSNGKDVQAKVTVHDMKVHPQLKSLCDKMDGEGLRNFLVANRKEATVMRDQLPCALGKCPDPLHFVLKMLQDYDPKPDLNSGKETKASSIRHVYLSLLESLTVAIADPVLGAEYPIVSFEAKQKAKELANSWRTKLGISIDAAKVCPLDAQTFLQVLATFNIASEFHDDELLELLKSISHRKKAPSLCRSLGLLGKIPDFLIKLAKDGKQFEALSVANSFEILDKIYPVSILKECLKEAKTVSEIALKNATNSVVKGQAIAKEVSAVKAVLRAITDYKLESQLPTSVLQMRLDELERMKEEQIGGSIASQSASGIAKLNNRVLNNSSTPARIATIGDNTRAISTAAATDSSIVSAVVAAITASHKNTLSSPVATTHDSTVLVPAVACVATPHDSTAFVPAIMAATHSNDTYGGVLSSGLSIGRGYGEHQVTSTYGAPSSSSQLSGSYPCSSDKIISAYGPASTSSTFSELCGGYHYTSSLEEASSHRAAMPLVYQSIDPLTYDPFRL